LFPSSGESETVAFEVATAEAFGVPVGVGIHNVIQEGTYEVPTSFIKCEVTNVIFPFESQQIKIGHDSVGSPLSFWLTVSQNQDVYSATT